MSPGLAEFVFAVLFVIFFFTQIILPCFVPKMKFFWILGRSEKKIAKKERRLAEIHDERREAEMDVEVARAEKDLNDFKGSQAPPQPQATAEEMKEKEVV